MEGDRFRGALRLGGRASATARRGSGEPAALLPGALAGVIQVREAGRARVALSPAPHTRLVTVSQHLVAIVRRRVLDDRERRSADPQSGGLMFGVCVRVGVLVGVAVLVRVEVGVLTPFWKLPKEMLMS